MSNYRKPPFFVTAEDNDEYDLTELEEDEVLRRLINLILDEKTYETNADELKQRFKLFKICFETTLKIIQSKYKGESWVTLLTLRFLKDYTKRF